MKNSGKYLRSPLKWAGGKYRVLERISSALPTGERLVEPFLGSGVVFLNTDYPAYFLADLNADLIGFFRDISSGGKNFINYCASYFTPKSNNADFFYKLRGRFNELEPGPERSAIFLYLNRHAFNGLVRYNASGHFNTPFGRYKRPYFPHSELEAVAGKCRRCDVLFEALDFKKTFAALQPGDVVYCDPPYLALSHTANFIGYTGSAFGQDEQLELAKAAEKARANGCPVAISNHATSEAMQLYKNASIEHFKVSRPISCKKNGRGNVDELIAVYGV